MFFQAVKDFYLWTFLDLVEDFIILFLVVLFCEWFAMKKRYNLFLRAWLVTAVILTVLMVALWKTYGRLLNWL